MPYLADSPFIPSVVSSALTAFESFLVAARSTRGEASIAWMYRSQSGFGHTGLQARHDWGRKA